MRWFVSCACIAVCCCAAIFIIGCSQVQPQAGTRVVFALPQSNIATRAKIAELGRYLVSRSVSVLDVDRPRVDSVTDQTLVLLLPNKRVPLREVSELLQETSLQLFHLSSVATEKHPERAWKMMLPTQDRSAYLFLGPDAQRVDSLANPRELLKNVVEYPANNPILTGREIQRDASLRKAGKYLGDCGSLHFRRGENVLQLYQEQPR